MKRKQLFWLITFISLLIPSPVYAHEPSNAPVGGFLTGVLHPILGLDHLLAMLCVGFLGMQIGTRFKWQLPVVFVFFMAVGSAFGIIGLFSIPMELGILLSMVMLGVLVALGGKFPAWIALLSSSLSAIFHGFAHGVEVPPNVSPAAFILGFLVGTTSIIGVGSLIGDITNKYKAGKIVLRVIGGIISVYGLLLLTGIM